LNKEKRLIDKDLSELQLCLAANGHISSKKLKPTDIIIFKLSSIKRSGTFQNVKLKPVIITALIVIILIAVLLTFTSRGKKYKNMVISYSELEKIGNNAVHIFRTPTSMGGGAHDIEEVYLKKDAWLREKSRNVNVKLDNNTIILSAQLDEFIWELEINSVGRITKRKDNGSPVQEVFTAIENDEFGEFKKKFKLLNIDPNEISTNSVDVGDYFPSLLSLASSLGRTNVVKFLLKNGADPNLPDKSVYDGIDSYPIIRSSSNNHYDIVKHLLENGAKPVACDIHHNDAIQAASKKGYYKIVELLLEHEADPNSRNEFGENAIQGASEIGNYKIVKLLLEHGADPNVTSEHGYAAIHYASAKGSLNIVELLVKKGSNVDFMYYSPVNEAIDNGHLQVIKYLIDNGAEWEQGNNYTAPFDYAQKSDDQEIVSYFRKLKENNLLKSCKKITIRTIFAENYKHRRCNEVSLSLSKDKTYQLRDGSFAYSGKWKIDGDLLVLHANWSGGLGNMGDEYDIDESFDFGVKSLDHNIAQSIMFISSSSGSSNELNIGDVLYFE